MKTGLENPDLQQLVALCPDGIIAVDRSGIIVLFNRAAEKLTGRRSSDVLGKLNIAEIYAGPLTAREVKKAIYSQDYGGCGRLEGYEVQGQTADGTIVPIHLSATLLTKDGREIGSVGFFHDLSARKQLEEKLQHLSITDGLTGLYNHRHFHYCLGREIERTRRYKRPLSLVCFDLDRFKVCNDTMGHLEGDNILRSVGELLGGILRCTDRAFRYGGDEFFILLPETDLDQAIATAEKIRLTFNERWPYVETCKGRKAVRVTLSLGAAQVAAGETGAILIKRADLAMYEAKKEGGDRVVPAVDFGAFTKVAEGQEVASGA